jgi:hypothetical protein
MSWSLRRCSPSDVRRAEQQREEPGSVALDSPATEQIIVDLGEISFWLDRAGIDGNFGSG